MNVSHINILQLLAVEIEPHRRKFSMISELMTNGTILDYIRVNKANRIRLVGPSVVDASLGWNR